jgi:hypothetical protein
VSFLEALAFDYQASQRLDDALKTWQELYEVAKSASFNLATAEAANGAAIIYQAKKEFHRPLPGLRWPETHGRRQETCRSRNGRARL